MEKIDSSNILIVDDNPANLHLLVDLLSEYRYEISIARSGEEALKIAGSTLPDLILLDIMMPDMDGYTVCENLKSASKTQDIPVIFLSALGDFESKVKGFSLGGVDYISKPFHKGEVLARISTHLSLAHTRSSLESTVAELKTSEKARKRSENHLNTILNSLPQLIGYLDSGFRIVYANHSVEFTTGKPFDKMIGKNISDVVSFENYSEIQPFLEKSKSGEPSNGELCFTDLKGESHNMDIQVIPDKEDNGLLKGFFTVLTDITSYKQNEMVICNLQKQMETVLNSIDSTVYVTDIKTHDILYANEKCLLEFGDVFGKKCYSVMQVNQTSPCSFCKMDNIVDSDGNPTGVYSWEYQSPVNNRWYLSADVATHWIDGRVVRTAIATDLTDKKLAERALKEVNKKLNLLSSITRHDVLNQLSIITASLDLVEKEVEDEELQHIINVQMNAASTINNLIQFTREYQNIGVKGAHWLDLFDSINSHINNFNEIEIDLSDDLKNFEIFGDPLLPKVFYNLVDNAVRYSDKSKIEFYVDESDHSLLIVCRDYGEGVPDDLKENIFNRGVGKNTGLGLFISREILSFTGISIHEIGKFGQGACFEMCVPNEGWRRKKLKI